MPVRLSLGDGGANGGGFARSGRRHPHRPQCRPVAVDRRSFVGQGHAHHQGRRQLPLQQGHRHQHRQRHRRRHSTRCSDICGFHHRHRERHQPGQHVLAVAIRCWPPPTSGWTRSIGTSPTSGPSRKNVKLQYGLRFEHDKNPVCVDNCFSRMSTEFLASGYQAGANVPYNSTIQTGLSYGVQELRGRAARAARSASSSRPSARARR